MAGNDKFYKYLNTIPDKVDSQLLKMQKVFMLDSLDRLASGTPVDKGVARANWNVSIGEVVLNFNENKTDYKANLTEQRKAITSLEKLNILYLSNSMPYILRIIEEGYSEQTPAGFGSKTVSDLRINYDFT